MRAALGVLGLALAGSALAQQQVDTVGGTSGSNTGSGSFKLTVYQVGLTVQLEHVGPYLEPASNAPEVVYVVYRRGVGGAWELVWDSGPVGIGPSLDYQISPPIQILLDQGEDYAIGVFLPEGNDVTYFWGDVGPQNLGWALVDEAVFASNGTVAGTAPPDPLFGQPSNAPYRQQIAVSFGEDGDGDGVGSLADCDDQDPTVYPRAEERCDGVDNDCDGDVDEDLTWRDGFPDLDGDGYGDPEGEPLPFCEPAPPPGYADNDDDCDDTNPAVHPGAEEVCDGVDNDCDGDMPVEEGTDADRDGIPVCADCDDDDPETWPGRPDDPCNGVDNDCDGEVPSGDAACDPLEAGEGLSAASACDGCAHPGGGAAGALWLLPALWAGRRRGSHP